MPSGACAAPAALAADGRGDPGDPQAGDPDAPGGGKSLPKPGSGRGASSQPSYRNVSPGMFGMWMLRLRMAFAAVYRVWFRI